MPVNRRSQKHHVLASAIVLVLAAPGVAFAQSGDADPATSTARTLDSVTVTGSRIKRTDVEAALPVTIIQKQEIQAQGITSAEQLLQFLNISGNGSDNLVAQVGVASDEMRGNNGVSGANLRGQGADATLVLLNGRRVATHGLRGQAVDLNSIPFAAIDRVEVLRDGASAVYGTDAIGGVINFITRSDYQGVTVNAGFDVTHDGGGDIYNASVLGGLGDIDADRWNAWGTLNWKKSEVLHGRDRDFARTFQANRGLSPDTRGTPFATVTNSAGGIITGSLPDPGGDGNQAFINILDLPGGPGCEAGGDMMGPYEHQMWGVANAKYACAWDYPRARVMQQPVESVQALGRASVRIGDDHLFYVEGMGSRVKSNRQFEFQQISSGTTGTLNPSTWYPLSDVTRATYNEIYEGIRQYFYPGSAPLTSVGNLVYGNKIPYRWRCEACGPREVLTTTTAWRLLAGMEGRIGTWNYDAGLSRASSRGESTLGDGYFFTTELQQALGSGHINPFIMPGESQSQQGLDMLRAASAAGVKLYGGESVVTTLDASFAGGLGVELWGGEVQLATGIELRREEFGFAGVREGPDATREIYQAPFDVNNDQPDVDRDVKAVYVETYLPVHDTLELTLAVRHDDYDTFGGTTNPKYSFKWQPFDALAIRGAYSTGFKAPEFTKLFGGRLEGEYTGLDLADPATCSGGIPNSSVPGCESINRPLQVFGGNIDLRPEESEQKSVGMVYAPTDHFSMSVDWWKIERLNTIRAPDINMLRDFYHLFSDRWIRNPDGSLNHLDRTFANTGGTLMSGIELDATLDGELAGGVWRINLNGSYIDSFQQRVLAEVPYTDNEVGKYVRFFNLPLRWKHTLNLGYAKGDWAHTLTQVYRDGYRDEPPVSVVRGTWTPPEWKPDVDEYITYNYGVTWTGMENTKITFVVRNLLNTDPPFTAHQNDFASGAAWEARIGDPRGRSYSLFVEHRFE
jgi:iron complex outermembrane receptor protein